MADPPDDPPAMAIAVEWVSRVIAIGFVTILPCLGGFWIDAKLGTSFVGIIGFALGSVAGMYSLLAVAKAANQKRSTGGSEETRQRDSRK